MESNNYNESEMVNEVDLLQEALGSGAWNMTFNQNGEMTSVKWSQVFRRMIGYKDESDFPNEFSSFEDRLHPDDRERVVNQYWNAVKDYTNRTIYDTEYKFLTHNRGYRWFHAAGRIARREDGSPISIVGFFIDIDDKKKLEENLKAADAVKSEQLRILKSLADMYYSMHLINLKTGTITEYSSGGELKEFLDKKISAPEKMRLIMENVIVPQYRDSALEFTDLTTISERMRGIKTLSSEFIGQHTGWFIANFISVETDNDGCPTVVLFSTQVIDERKQQEQVLFLRSVTDDMTGFLNRRAYEAQLEYYRRNPIPDNLVFTMFDINHLKQVNDTLGHAAGDELIYGFADIAEKLKHLQGKNKKIYRTGGDEFVGIFYLTPDEYTIGEREFFIHVNQWQGKLVKNMSISAGHACKVDYPDANIDELAKLADERMYKAKAEYYKNNGLDRRNTSISQLDSIS
ncbi:PAS domain S-box-containing protein/diguanylate cyclase (GGDEF) domain-containing protein [Succinivibrio dextrinosolvens]|uniref:sensor domain-containing diguanylate cyclase n=1 Tax=Succinivibrio dextrinosolvens TaxID=83771 RepID=UPI0008E16BF1|nr:sensor domain-containing diguanylate cyclase [Succinivibrio dextrinosolvens]SFS44640.1 PAS domain S-box-containing protein/diguanylate cyclase (GGDEF) domain-containing protein [Succinivibrio dextrinosolvens]